MITHDTKNGQRNDLRGNAGNRVLTVAHDHDTTESSRPRTNATIAPKGRIMVGLPHR